MRRILNKLNFQQVITCHTPIQRIQHPLATNTPRPQQFHYIQLMIKQQTRSYINLQFNQTSCNLYLNGPLLIFIFLFSLPQILKPISSNLQCYYKLQPDSTALCTCSFKKVKSDCQTKWRAESCVRTKFTTSIHLIIILLQSSRVVIRPLLKKMSLVICTGLCYYSFQTII